MAKLDLSNKKFIISAAAQGIGYAIAKKIIDNGGIVYLCDKDEKKIKLINSNVKYKKKIYAKKIDCNNIDEIREYFNSLKHLNKIDGLINNIGIAGPTQNLENISIEE